MHSLIVAATVTLLHFSDYHSHALPFHSEEGPDRGGIARAIGFMARHKAEGALVFSGGDMMNKGAPAWSDRYRCAEWTWLDGIVDAMAFGNHDADYGYRDFAACRDAIRYPILSANTGGFPPYTVLESNGIRIGVFAVAGQDFPGLVRASVPELRFGDPVAAASEAVRTLREVEKVDAVVLIGHETAADDFALARKVAGIDLILGTHSHLKQDLMQIPGTQTWFISPSQYLAWISRVKMEFAGRRLAGVSGGLVPVDARMEADRGIEQRVAAMQDALRVDPQYRQLFVPFATLPAAIEVRDLAALTVELMKKSAGADIALSTSSSFRGPLPAGPVDVETLRAALPYDNEIVVAQLPAAKARELLAYAGGQKGDAFAFTTGKVEGETALVATTDYLATMAAGYRDFFEGAVIKRTGVRVREEVKRKLEK
ncbi:MAG TPA: 5'-nucleotidase C-terminal domain-containing protein [Thermoanaerobaculia bacterium]|nr:5'-nucleotidase C-terminal domain-containing protein [Thermoanaerobaculia bacterium]